jgi:hypothetical protein
MRKRLLALFGCLALAAGVAAAQDNQPQPASAPQREAAQAAAGQSITGMLVDATCRAASPSAECEVSAGTTSFGILTSDGRFLKFDGNGNTLAKSEIEKSKKTGKVSATVTGSVDGTDTVRVENLSFS